LQSEHPEDHKFETILDYIVRPYLKKKINKEEIKTKTHTEAKPCEETGNRWPSANQGKRPSEETSPTDSLMAGFWPLEL
jgi:hypothetical protein